MLLSTTRPAPTIRELANATGTRSLSMIFKDLTYLGRQGYIARGEFRTSRNIRVLIPLLPGTITREVPTR